MSTSRRQPITPAVRVASALLAILAFSVGRATADCRSPSRGGVAAGGESLCASRGDDDEQTRDERERGRRSHREFWRSLSEDERRELSALYELLKKRPSDSRRRILDRLRELPAEERLAAIAQAREGILREDVEWDRFEKALQSAERDNHRKFKDKLPEELRAKLEGVTDEDARRRIIGQFFHEHFQATRRQVLDQLPRTMRERVEALPPREQANFIRAFRGHELLRSVFRSPSERKKILGAGPSDLGVLVAAEKLPPDEWERPSFVEDASWERWVALKGYERLRVLRTLLMIARGEEDPLKRERGERRRGRGEGDRSADRDEARDRRDGERDRGGRDRDEKERDRDDDKRGR